MSFSNSSGGTLTVPSPTHVHHVDVLASSVRGLRRSLSRSPSKFSLARTNSLESTDSSHSGSHTPVQQQSPCRRYTPTPTPPSSSGSNSGISGLQDQHPLSFTPAGLPPSMLTSTTPLSSPPSLATPFRPSVRLSLRSAKSSKVTGSPSRPVTRLRTSPKSPLKRALNATSDSGNSTPSCPSSASSSESPGQENNGQVSPLSRSNFQKSSRHSFHLDGTGHAQQASIFRSIEGQGESQAVPGSGALKRSDAIMNLDQASLGSPVAKRRSLHGISSFGQTTPDFNIFDNNANTNNSNSGTPGKTNFDIHDEANREYELFGSSGSSSNRDPLPSPTPPPQAPRRTGSLRKSTLQQRQHDRSSWGRRSGANHLAQMSGDFSTPNSKNRPRLSMDQFLPPQAPRDSPFSSNPPLPNPSAHPIERSSHQPHPLSKTLVTSTSGNSLEEQNNSMPPPSLFEKPRAPINFAKSMPYGSSRPSFMQEDNNENVTPFKAAKPWAGAFMSTGLVSKVNRNPEEFDNKLTMPDTPCKKPTNGFATFPPPPGSVMKKNNRYSFGGMPSTPFNAPGAPSSRSTFGNPGKGLGIFQRMGSRHARRGSVLSLDDDKKFSLETNFNVDLAAATTDAPPTPTKQGLTPSLSNLSEQSIESPSAKRSLPFSAVRPMISRESTGECTPERKSNNRGASGPLSSSPLGSTGSPTSGLSPTSRLSLPSFGRSRSCRGFSAPSPLRTRFCPSTFEPQKDMLAKITSHDTASPVEQRSPRTPSTHMVIPDASCLSISNPPEPRSVAAPSTPSGRDSFQSTTTQLMTPVNVRGGADVDDSLYSRFDKVEMVGKGEFSSVYRVVKSGYSRASFLSVFSGTPTKNSRESPEPDRIYAVKKARRPFTGPKDRLAKLREVQALQALTHADHVLHYVDSWEANQYLYIQTEFCDEGTLDKFLSNVGRKGRLDDFRIWKVIHDIGLGLQSIHEAGFIHLDLKPANILITFEGILKIGDFGLATEWPAAKGVDAEGDREYIGPEILRGEFNKPADIFSLGLITIEMAANVVLPDNGPTWIALRSGDLSEVPSLTFSATTTTSAQRDAAGVPTMQSFDDPLLAQTSAPDISLHSGIAPTRVNVVMDDSSSPFITRKRTELRSPPDFMSDPFHPSSLDQIVRWMIRPEPSERPTIQQLLSTPAMTWVADRRRSAATVFEGVWGPSESTSLPTLIDEALIDETIEEAVIDEDTEMMDV
ncbi:Mitosis inhibitor protein kinase wee1 [Colletotrichum siamense]|uniref:Mitosis inhibitor protein kinase wee1 n=1 Tax=Colletotrichum siamense TaxID=690259 RepID=UPI001872BF36|nr:Mitosis inhibitor protein kinase wee1 [Colletotrichum siamense]KAF5486839.1 Mitosis inhibitor protein kinase wee1 [Colletotrichum siamense]